MRATISLIVFLISSTAAFSPGAHAAGRESHGLLPGGFLCAPELEGASPYRVSLNVLNQVVTSASLTIGKRSAKEMPCEDSFASRQLGPELESTATCTLPGKDGYFLELLENNASEAQLKIWKSKDGMPTALLEILPCH